MGWLLFMIIAVAALATRLYKRRPRLAGPALAPLLSASDPDEGTPLEALVRITLTDRPEFEGARLAAIRALGELADPKAKPALQALIEPGATFSSSALRQEARQALGLINAAIAPTRGQVSLAEPGSEQGALSTPDDSQAS